MLSVRPSLGSQRKTTRLSWTSHLDGPSGFLLWRPLAALRCQRHSLICSVNGQPDEEAGSAGLRFKFNLASVPIGDNAVADNQTKASPGADRFGGEERL